MLILVANGKSRVSSAEQRVVYGIANLPFVICHLPSADLPNAYHHASLSIFRPLEMRRGRYYHETSCAGPA